MFSPDILGVRQAIAQGNCITAKVHPERLQLGVRHEQSVPVLSDVLWRQDVSCKLLPSFCNQSAAFWVGTQVLDQGCEAIGEIAHLCQGSSLQEILPMFQHRIVELIPAIVTVHNHRTTQQQVLQAC